MMALSCSTWVLFVAAAVLVCLLGSTEGKPTCLDQPQKEFPRDKRMAENPTTLTGREKTVTVTCYRGEPCCFSCSYDPSKVVKGFSLRRKQNSTEVFVCDAIHGPQADPDTYTFKEEQQQLCLNKGFHIDSEAYLCKMQYTLDSQLRDSVTVNEVTVTDKLGTPTVHLENKGPVKEGRDKVNFTCSLDTKFELDLISVTWYNGSKVLNSEDNTNSTNGNRITFSRAYNVTRFDNRQEIYCTVTYGDQTKTSNKVPLDVQYKPRVDCNITAQLVVGHPAEVNCSIDANPGVPSSSIVFPMELLEIGWVQSGSNISTTHLRPPCNKTFSVTATNEWGSGEGDFEMDCWFEVSIIANKSHNRFTCRTKGNPVPEISWFVDYENGPPKSYNSTASTVDLDVEMLTGATAVTCMADQHQPLYFQRRFHKFHLAVPGKHINCSSGPCVAGILVAFVVALGLGIFLENKCHIWERLKQQCTKCRQLPVLTAVPRGGDTGLPNPAELQALNEDKQFKLREVASDGDEWSGGDLNIGFGNESKMS